jgi:hypothetical protein
VIGVFELVVGFELFDDTAVVLGDFDPMVFSYCGLHTVLICRCRSSV